MTDIALYSKEIDASVIHFFDEIDSTNNYAKELASKGAPAGTLVVAASQTSGRGRMGRAFQSPSGSGIYMSLVLRPGEDFTDAVPVTSAAAVAVCRAIRQMTGADAGIKWVNDIYINEKKACGILTEAVPDPSTGKLDSVVVGIGINFAKPSQEVIKSMPQDVQERITWLYGSSEKPPVTPAQLTAKVVDEVIAVCREAKNRDYIAEYKKYSVILGRQIVFISAGEKQNALAQDIDKDGGLVVLMPDNTIKTLFSGEISVRWAD
ncbi:MAG: biotin--[Firmicutes bacterium]|nr:biotin--[acetyl-CoA-carboxylase] ligase [Bacillota bacterium]